MIDAAHALLALLTMIPQAQQTREEAIQLETPGGVIHGTLMLPEKLPAPIALIIAGSGPTDRNGNSPAIPGQNNSLKYLAQGLAERGIASVRYDKRGVAESIKAATSETNLRFTTYADDATDWIAKLRKDARFTNIAVIGHSEGSLIGLLAVPRAGANGFVSLSGAGRRAGVILREQLKAGIPDTAMYNRVEKIIVELEAGRTVENVSPELAQLFRPSVQPYIISWLPLDPAVLIGKLTVPALLIQGTTDLQVSVNDAQALAKGKPDAKLFIVDGMNHVLKAAPLDRTQNIAAYTDPSLPVVPRVIEEIAAFINGLKK